MLPSDVGFVVTLKLVKSGCRRFLRFASVVREHKIHGVFRLCTGCNVMIKWMKWKEGSKNWTLETPLKKKKLHVVVVNVLVIRNEIKLITLAIEHRAAGDKTLNSLKDNTNTGGQSYITQKWPGIAKITWCGLWPVLAGILCFWGKFSCTICCIKKCYLAAFALLFMCCPTLHRVAGGASGVSTDHGEFQLCRRFCKFLTPYP